MRFRRFADEQPGGRDRGRGRRRRGRRRRRVARRARRRRRQVADPSGCRDVAARLGRRRGRGSASTAVDRVADAVRAEILTGALPADAPLREEAAAATVRRLAAHRAGRVPAARRRAPRRRDAVSRGARGELRPRHDHRPAAAPRRARGRGGAHRGRAVRARHGPSARSAPARDALDRLAASADWLEAERVHARVPPGARRGIREPAHHRGARRARQPSCSCSCCTCGRTTRSSPSWPSTARCSTRCSRGGPTRCASTSSTRPASSSEAERPRRPRRRRDRR